MNINFTAKNLELRENQTEYILEKIKKLSKYGERLADESTQGKVDVEQDLKHASGKIIFLAATIYVPGDTLRAEVRATTVEEAADFAYEKLKSQAESYKAKTEHQVVEDLPIPQPEEEEFNF
ncbi:MAG: HPF/RaiA family ribosome-associated protein [Candidatus Gracilibacteria bacterium]|nr:HPF/RaiA family ribosome-associated protein [Candidatus Gracilibacteria bacterium]